MASCGSAEEMSSKEGITVAIRVRPLNQRELSHESGEAWRILPQYNAVEQMTAEGESMPERRDNHNFFQFDKVRELIREQHAQSVYVTVVSLLPSPAATLRPRCA
jgi:hypothetical protein